MTASAMPPPVANKAPGPGHKYNLSPMDPHTHNALKLISDITRSKMGHQEWPLMPNGAPGLGHQLQMRPGMPHDGGRSHAGSHGHPLLPTPGMSAGTGRLSLGSPGGSQPESIDLTAPCCNSGAELKGVREELAAARAELAAAKEDAAAAKEDALAAREDAAAAKEEVAKRDAEVRRMQVEVQKSRVELHTARAELSKVQAEFREREAQAAEGAREELQKKLVSTTLLVLQLSGLDSQITPELWLQTPACAQDLLLQYALQGA